MAIVRGFSDLPKDEVKSYQANDSQVRKLPWADEVIVRMAKTSTTVSSNMAWYQEEYRKRALGLENEIDKNEIKAAGKGVKNKWINAIIEKPDLFKSFLINGKNIDWQSVKDLKNG